jgi:KaiC/GvpD/RAD55 family RecA-like ATPase
LETSLALPIIDELVPKGIKYAATYLIEFGPDSPWFEASLTVAAGALKNGIRTEFHTYMHPPSEVRDSLVKMGLHPKSLEESDQLRILDTYDVMTGLAHPETPSGMRSKGREPYEHQSFDINHWSERVVKMIRDGVAEDEKQWLHVDDNTSIMINYAEEKSMVDVWRTRIIPYAKMRGLAMFHSVMTGIASDSFYKQFESLCDGIIDFRSGEEAGRVEHYARVRTIRGMHCDTRWRKLRLRNDGSVVIDQSEKPKEFGISAWLKGPGK